MRPFPDMLQLLFKSLLARARAGFSGCPGLKFDDFGRLLALREMMGGRTDRIVRAAFLSPVSCVRYMEFDYAASALAEMPDGARVLDVSSPRLFALALSRWRDLKIVMTNPDARDIARTRELADLINLRGDLEIFGEADARHLPFASASFDAAFSISVIEHVGDEASQADSAMMVELARVVRPGGRIVLTFPVQPTLYNEFRDNDPYGLRGTDDTDRYFFQRFYDKQAIAERLLSVPGLRETDRTYWVENEPGWFAAYEREWMVKGLAVTVADPLLMARHFHRSDKHPSDRTGICCLTIEVDDV